MNRSAIFIFLVLAFVGCSDHSNSEKDFPARSVTVNGNTFNYRIYVPENRDPASKVPVLLYLHGSGSRGDDNQSQLGDISSIVSENRERFPFVIVFPQCRPGTFWAGEMTQQAMAALDQTVAEFNGDPNRLYLAGFSMGGFGTWQTAITYPDRFAALVPVAGGIQPIGVVSDEDRAKLSPQVTAAVSAPDPYRAYADALRSVPVWIVHGADDESVPVDASRKIAAALKAAGADHVNYVELEGVGHISMIKAFSDPRLPEWLAKQNRKISK